MLVVGDLEELRTTEVNVGICPLRPAKTTQSPGGGTIKPRRAARSNGALVIDDPPSGAGLLKRGSVIQVWIPPSHEVCQILMCSTRTRGQCAQLATRAVTPHQREVQYDYPAVSFSLPSLLILATAILETNGAARLPVRQDPMRVDLEAMAITFTRLD